MGIYSHLTDEELRAKRDKLLTAMERAASGTASVSSAGRSVSYQSSLSEARRLLNEVQAELARREGAAPLGPIYLVGR